MRNLSVAIAVIVFALFGSPAEAKLFKNAYISFELPEKWDCVLEQTEWVCRPVDAQLAPQAVIILTAKEVGPQDSLEFYEQHLKTPVTIASRTGQPLQSQIIKIERRNIANQSWVDAMHMASEVPNYYTRYLATTKDKIGILVTFSAHKLYYTKFSGDFFRAIESLRVVATKSLMQGSGGGSGAPGSETLGTSTALGLAGGDSEAMPEEGSGAGGAVTAKTIMGFAFIVGAIGCYLLIKRGKKKKK